MTKKAAEPRGGVIKKVQRKRRTSGGVKKHSHEYEITLGDRQVKKGEGLCSKAMLPYEA